MDDPGQRQDRVGRLGHPSRTDVESKTERDLKVLAEIANEIGNMLTVISGWAQLWEERDVSATDDNLPARYLYIGIGRIRHSLDRFSMRADKTSTDKTGKAWGKTMVNTRSHGFAEVNAELAVTKSSLTMLLRDRSYFRRRLAMPSPETLIDLVRHARQGDPSAYADLVRTYLRPAYAVALAITGRPEDAEAIAQDALCRTLARIRACGVASHFPAWLLQRVRKEARHFVRSHPREAVGTANSGGSRVVQQEPCCESDGLVVALLGLDERAREVLLLHDLADWSLWQVGESLGMCEAELRRQLFEARRFLHARLMKQE
jgi:RNA polymerase sigma-70 factor, ECF subfamily